MLFNSFIYIFCFFPFVAIIFHFLNHLKYFQWSKIFLCGCSLLFFGWWNPVYLPLLIISIIVNYVVGYGMNRCADRNGLKKLLVIVGVSLNLAFLGYFKYRDFFIENVNAMFGTNFILLQIVLPLGISFFTLQQLTYLMDSYQDKSQEYSFSNYFLFVSFFPQLIAGPIVHHKEMMPQFETKKNHRVDYKNLSSGLFIFAIGLFKKVIVADTLAVWVNNGFNEAVKLTFVEAWYTSLFYTFQIYFDFSGYTDMAMGSALMLNIKLPINFNSPYKATSIQDFWRCWHVTLSRFLKDYIYIPFGGSKAKKWVVFRNIFIVFLIGGFWHGAGWTFILWGFLHGVASVVHRWWRNINIKIPNLISWFLTFIFVNFTWVFFRAMTLNQALSICKGMLGFNGIVLPGLFSKFRFFGAAHVRFGYMLEHIKVNTYSSTLFIGLLFLVILKFPNSMELKKMMKPNKVWMSFVIFLLAFSILSLSKPTEFIYFNF